MIFSSAVLCIFNIAEGLNFARTLHLIPQARLVSPVCNEVNIVLQMRSPGVRQDWVVELRLARLVSRTEVVTSSD